MAAATCLETKKMPFYFLLRHELTSPVFDAINGQWTTERRGGFPFSFSGWPQRATAVRALILTRDVRRCGLNSDHVPYGFLSSTNKIQVWEPWTGYCCWLLLQCTVKAQEERVESQALGNSSRARGRDQCLSSPGSEGSHKGVHYGSPRNSIPKSQIIWNK